VYHAVKQLFIDACLQVGLIVTIEFDLIELYPFEMLAGILMGTVLAIPVGKKIRLCCRFSFPIPGPSRNLNICGFSG
jgi:hypothetical protein